MGICRYCGQSAGWFRDVHNTCAISCRQGCEKVTSVVASTIKEKVNLPTGHPDTEDWYSEFASQLWSDLQRTVQKLTSEHSIPSDDLRKALKEGWSTGSQELAIAEPLPTDKLAIMVTLYRLMGFSDADVSGTDGFITANLSRVLWSVMVSGNPSLLASVHPHPFNLNGVEIPLIFLGSVVYSKETASRSYQGGYGGMSVRVARGMYYHFGGFKGQRIDTSTLTEIDYGVLLLTTQNIYFGGDHTNFRIAYEHIISFRPHTDGIGLFRDGANAKAEVFTVLEPNSNGGEPVSARPAFGWFLFNMAHFLAQPEARTLYANAET